LRCSSGKAPGTEITPSERCRTVGELVGVGGGNGTDPSTVLRDATGHPRLFPTASRLKGPQETQLGSLVLRQGQREGVKWDRSWSRAPNAS
jgi:hypothetical protein